MPTKEEIIARLNKRKQSAPETRSRRVQLLITPTMYDVLKGLSQDTDVSVNEIINDALSEYISRD